MSQGSAKRTPAEVGSHAWNAGISKDLDFALSFNVRSEALLVTGSVRQLEASYRNTANAFGGATVALLAQLESFALRLCIHARSREVDPGRGQDWDAQILEEARHYGALQRYLGTRWATPPRGCDSLEEWLSDVLDEHRDTVPTEALGFVECVARGVALMLHSQACDPLLVRLCSFILADEQFHSSMQTFNENFRAPASSAVKHLEEAMPTDDPEAREDLLRLLATFSVEWSSVLPADRLWSEPADQAGAMQRLRSLGSVAAGNALEYLSRLRHDADAIPPIGLAAEWLAAGLRGRGDSPSSRRRWLPAVRG